MFISESFFLPNKALGNHLPLMSIFSVPNELAQLPATIRDNLPALAPPPGVQSNFINPENRGHIFIFVASLLLFLKTLFFVNRVYTKAFINRKLGWDDCKYLPGTEEPDKVADYQESHRYGRLRV